MCGEHTYFVADSFQDGGRQHQMHLHPGMRAHPSHIPFILRNFLLIDPFPVGRCCGCHPMWNRAGGCPPTSSRSFLTTTTLDSAGGMEDGAGYVCQQFR